MHFSLVQIHNLFLQIKLTSNLIKKLVYSQTPKPILITSLVILEWVISKMLHKALSKVELNFIMEIIGEPYLQQISTWHLQMYFAGISIQDLELLAGQVLRNYHKPDNWTSQMVSKNQFWWIIFHATELKLTLANAITQLWAAILIRKILLSLARD